MYLSGTTAAAGVAAAAGGEGDAAGCCCCDDVAVDTTGNIFVIDRNNNRVQQFDASGTYTAQWGSGGSSTGQFNNPYGLAVDSVGDIYVIDNGNDRVQKFGPDLIPPVIMVNSPEIDTVEFEGTWTEPGAAAVDAIDGIVTVTIGGDTIDPNATIGTIFTVTYDAVDAAGNNAQETRSVTVIDTEIPVLTVVSPGITSVEAGSTWVDPGAIATDNSGSATVTIGGDAVNPNAAVGTVFIVIYDAVDGSGNNAIQAARSLTVIDTTVPVISVTSPGITTVEFGTIWNEPGATVTDNSGSATLFIGGDTVDPNAVAGTIFTITYNATDGSGNNATQATRNVTVVDTIAPTIRIGRPSTPNPGSGPVVYVVSYTGATSVTLSNGDVTLVKSGTADGTINVSGSGLSLRTVTISGITGDGTLSITIAAGTAMDGASNAAPAPGPGIPFSVDNNIPTLSSGRLVMLMLLLLTFGVFGYRSIRSS